MSAAHETAIMDLLVELSDTLVTDSDVDTVLHHMTDHCLALLNAQMAGVLVADERGVLRLLAASPEHSAGTVLFEAPATPGDWSFVTGQPVTDADLGRPDQRWPAFGRQAAELGFRSVAALPMRVRGDVIGVLSLLRHRPGPFSADDMRLARALANMVTVGLLLQHDPEDRTVLAAQAQRVLSGRVSVERARGILAELLDVDVDTALGELRRHSRRTGQSLSVAADEVVRSIPVTGWVNGSGPVLLAHRVTAETLNVLRTLVRQRMATAGLSGPLADKFLLAVHEAAANADEHGGGGRLWLWRHGGELWCEVSDDGLGLPAGFTIRTVAPTAESLHHLGLWLIRRICPDMRLTSGPGGTRVLLRLPLSGHAAELPPPAAEPAAGG